MVSQTALANRFPFSMEGGVSKGKLKHSALSPVTLLTKCVPDSRSGGSENVWTEIANNIQETVKRQPWLCCVELMGLCC